MDTLISGARRFWNGRALSCYLLIFVQICKNNIFVLQKKCSSAPEIPRIHHSICELRLYRSFFQDIKHDLVFLYGLNYLLMHHKRIAIDSLDRRIGGRYFHISASNYHRYQTLIETMAIYITLYSQQ